MMAAPRKHSTHPAGRHGSGGHLAGGGQAPGSFHPRIRGGGAAPAPAAGAADPGSGDPSLLGRGQRVWRRICRFSDWLDDHWIGDLIAVVCLFGSTWMLLFFVWAVAP